MLARVLLVVLQREFAEYRPRELWKGSAPGKSAAFLSFLEITRKFQPAVAREVPSGSPSTIQSAVTGTSAA
jgi:hypothetical protein